MAGNEKQPLLGSNDPSSPTAPILEEPPPYMEQPSYPQPCKFNNHRSNPILCIDTEINNPAYPTPLNYPLPSNNPYGVPPPDSQAPPAYSSASPPLGQNLFVQCRVCQHVINVPQGTNSRVVKCSSCNEATVSIIDRPL